MLSGERLRSLREARGLSQGALGKLIEKEGQYVSKLERGKLTGITVETLERLADALDCTTDELLGRTKRELVRP
jgi:transcriptional regulator with XRE-family HTH domain